MKIHLETASNETLNTFRRLGIIGVKKYNKHLNQHYTRTTQRSFKSSMDRGTSQTFKRELGKKKYLSYKGIKPSTYENARVTRKREPTNTIHS